MAMLASYRKKESWKFTDFEQINLYLGANWSWSQNSFSMEKGKLTTVENKLI